MTATFVSPVSDLTVDTVFQDGATTTTFTVYDPLGNVLNQQKTTESNVALTYAGGGIGSFSVVFSSPSDDDVIGIDSVAFSTGATVVPEPASMTLLGVGAASLLGFVGVRRRKKVAAA